MKGILHRINVFLCILLFADGIALMVNAGDFFDSSTTFVFVCAAFQIIMAGVMLIMGSILPKKAQPLKKRTQTFLRILLLAASLSGKSGASSAGAMHVADGSTKIRRVWEPTVVLVWLIFQAIFSLFCFQDHIRIQILTVLTLVLLLLLLVTTVWWKILDEKEQGTYRLSRILAPLAAVCVLLIVAGGIAVLNDDSGNSDIPPFPDIDMEKTQQLIDDYLADDPFSNEDLLPMDLAELQEGFEQMIHFPETQQTIMTTGMSSEELVQQICLNFYPDDTYYKMLEDEHVYIVTWSEDSEDIVAYQIAKQEDGYMIVTAFVSSTLAKEDVEGKEDGIWHMS